MFAVFCDMIQETTLCEIALDLRLFCAVRGFISHCPAVLNNSLHQTCWEPPAMAWPQACWILSVLGAGDMHTESLQSYCMSCTVPYYT